MLMEISLITPVYNAAIYLPALIESVEKQDFTDYEWIICDDGSCDDSWSILRKAASTNDRIRLIGQENSGVSSARNACLRQISGKYLMFADADDTLEPGCLSALFRQMEESSSDLCIYGWYIHQKDKLFSYVFEKKETEATNEKLYQMILEDPYLCGGGYPWNKIWRVSSITENGSIPGFRENLSHYEDKLWTLERLDQIGDPSISWLNRPLYNYYLRGESLSHSMSAEKFIKLGEETIDSLDAIIEYVRHYHPRAFASAEMLRNDRIREIASVLCEAGITI